MSFKNNLDISVILHYLLVYVSLKNLKEYNLYNHIQCMNDNNKTKG